MIVNVRLRGVVFFRKTTGGKAHSVIDGRYCTVEFREREFPGLGN